ncbi:preprotein translocase subunit SecE [Patescibacteria group bacterium]|nr:preprotein translocase subunit SecE [Patescibacteria group bacterium]MBU1755188.1 preprotein translocase subunit SecE [Patescibacteria group bacterium]
MKNFFNYLKNVRAEMTHVVWPTQRQAWIHVALVIAISAIVALFIAGLDHLLTQLVEQVAL